MKISFIHGSVKLDAVMRGGRHLGAIEVGDAPALAPVEAAVRAALHVPIGRARPLRNIAKPGESLAIIVADSFRDTGAHWFIPVLLDELAQAGCRDEDIDFYFATGTHRPPTPDEQAAILGADVYERFRERLHNHDADDAANLVMLGTTRRGTPVWLNRRVHESDRIIATGSVVLHYFGGFGGGHKTVVPGVAGRATIAHNHAMNLHPAEDRLDPAVRIGVIEGNPVAEDLREAVGMTHVDAILNTVLNRRGEIAGVFYGELAPAHRAACAFARSLYGVPIQECADLVIAAALGPRNFVQTHKALYNAWQALKPGGRIVLVAPCPEGLGGEQFMKWLRLGDRAAIFAGLRRSSEINGQTALSTVEKAPSTWMVTELRDEDVRLLGARRAATLQEAIDKVAMESSGGDFTYYTMPSAAYTVPMPPA